jgi:muramoyltetrapeptide carboxypeptidase
MSGPMVAVEMALGIPPFTEKHYFQQVFNRESHYTIGIGDIGAQIMTGGKAEGVLLGGCLSLIASQLGTPYQPDFMDTILFIEDVGESSYKIDRFLAQLKQAGILNTIRGAILGEFLDCDPEPQDKDSFKINDIIHDYFDSLGIPVLFNFPYGHSLTKVSMPVGVHTLVDTSSGRITFGNPFKQDRRAGR